VTKLEIDQAGEYNKLEIETKLERDQAGGTNQAGKGPSRILCAAIHVYLYPFFLSWNTCKSVYFSLELEYM